MATAAEAEASPFYSLVRDRFENPNLSNADLLRSKAIAEASTHPDVLALDTQILRTNPDFAAPFVAQREARINEIADELRTHKYNAASIKEVFGAARDNLVKQTRIVAEADPMFAEFDAAIKVADPETRQLLIHEREVRLDEVMEELNKKRYDDSARAMVNMTDEDIAAHAAMVDAHLQNFRLKSQYANALQGSLFDQLNRPERELVDTVRGALGLSPDVIGGDFMAGKVAATLKMFGRDHEAVQAFNWINGVGTDIRAGIGNRQAANNVVRNVAEHILRNGGRQEVESILQPIIADLRGVGSKDGKSLAGKYEIADEHLDELMSLFSARVYQLRQTANPDRFATHIVKDGQLVEGPLAKHLRAAAENGMFDGKFNNGQYAGLLKDVDAMARKTVTLLDQLDLVDKYNASRTGYVPNLLTPLGQQEVSRAALNDNIGGQVRGAFGQMAEGFQKSRTSDLYQWQDAEGVWHQLQEGDFSWGSLPESQYRNVGLTPERIQAIDHAKAEIASFEKTYPGLDPETRWNLLAKNADPWTLNELAQTRYSALTGGSPIVNKLFSDNMLHLVLGRVQQEVNAAARDSWRPLMENTALFAPGQLEKLKVRSPDGTNLTFDNGVKGRIMHAEGNTPTKVRVGDVVYRKVKLPETDLTEPNLTKGLMSERDLQTWVPEQTAEFIERIVGAGQGEKNLNSILKLSESVTSLWKTATLIHPSWIAGNVVGIAWNAAAFGVPIDGMVKHMRDAWRTVVAGGDLTKLEGKAVSLAGREARLGDLAIDMERISGQSKGAELLDQARVTKTARYSEDIGNPKTAMERLSGMVPGIRSELAKRIELHADQYRLNGMGEVPFSTKLKIMLGTIHDQAYMRSFYGPWFAFNAKIEDTMRRAGYMALIDKGYAPEAAARKITEAFYDFADMTNGERSVRRHLIPFYSWLRNNAAGQMRLVLRDPKWINMYPKLKDAIEESIAGEDRMPQHMRPSWMREQLALQIGKDPATRYALNLGTVIPTEPVFNIGGALTGNDGIMNLVKYFTSGIAPLPSVLQQIGAGRETFTGRTIGPNPGEGDLSLGEFVANQARPIRELLPTGPRTPGLIAAAEKGPAPFAARLLAGGRAQPFDDERVRFQLVREFKDRESNYRKFINIAEREGDTKASLESRAKLLGLYQHAIGQGLEDQVPVWARTALGVPVKTKKRRASKKPKKAKQRKQTTS